MDANSRKRKAEWIAKKRAQTPKIPKRKKHRRSLDDSFELDVASTGIDGSMLNSHDTTIYPLNHIGEQILPLNDAISSREITEPSPAKPIASHKFDQDDGILNHKYITDEPCTDQDKDCPKIDKNEPSHSGKLDSSDDEDAPPNGTQKLSTKLQQWALKHGTTHRSLDELLKLLQDHVDEKVPRTARTLLGTKKVVQQLSISGGDYHYFGLDSSVTRLLTRYPQIDTLDLVLNIDGVPIAKNGSNASSLWPVLCKVSNVPSFGVFAVALWLSDTKPDNLEFLHDTLNDISYYTVNGFNHNGKSVLVRLCQVVCDAPARSMCKGTKYVSGYYGCDKCEIRGLYQYNKVTYPDFQNLKLRTDESFREGHNPQHHNEPTPFTDITNLDMIKDFPIDYMHQVLLGVMRKLLYIWVGEAKGRGRVNSQTVEAINQLLLLLPSQTPKEFARKPRTLNHVGNFKATELRTFLLYTGKMVLRRFLGKQKYRHFLCLSVAVTILLNSDLTRKHADLAQKLLESFVEKMGTLYGQKHMVYSIHSLVHVTADAKHYGNLNLCSAFDFENHMQVLKRLVRQRKHPLVELVARLSELEHLENRPNATGKYDTKPLSTKSPNNVYIASDGSIVELKRLRYINSSSGIQKSFVCRKHLTKGNFFTKPCDSSVIGIYQVDPAATCIAFYRPHELLHKCFRMEVGGKTVIQILLHDQ